MYEKRIIFGVFSLEQLDRLIHESLCIGDAGKRIDFLSRQFLGIDYAESTLIGDKDCPEVFVINLAGVDCLTFIEYVEAMRRSGSYSDFESNLKRVRYRSGIVDFAKRNHFFTDWKEFNSEFVDDVTEQIGGQKIIRIRKTLNEKENGGHLLPGIQLFEREILYIPSGMMDTQVYEKLGTGDYIGIYTGLKGLDVSHAGIVIVDGETLVLRHASSQKRHRKVIDEDFKSYIANGAGIIVLRPKDIAQVY